MVLSNQNIYISVKNIKKVFFSKNYKLKDTYKYFHISNLNLYIQIGRLLQNVKKIYMK